MFFHVTLTLGRSDSTVLEADNKSDIINYFKSVSTAVLSSLKKIVYSKDLDINYTSSKNVVEDYYKQVLVFCKSNTKAKVYNLYNVRKSVTEKDILKAFELLMIDDEIVKDIYKIQFMEL